LAASPQPLAATIERFARIHAASELRKLEGILAGVDEWVGDDQAARFEAVITRESG
jgi:hypothetical protein